MKRRSLTKKGIAWLLSLMLILSLLGGAVFTAGAAGIDFMPAPALEEGGDYLIVTPSGEDRYAFSYDGSALVGQKVTLADDTITVDGSEAIWTTREGSTVENAGSPGTFVFAGSHGLMTYTGGRTFVYDPDSSTILMHNMYYLTFDAETGAFGQSTNPEEAAYIELYSKVPVFTKTDAVTEDDQFVFAVPAGDGYKALGFDGSVLAPMDITVADDTVALRQLDAAWFAREGDTVENAGSPGTFIFAGSHGLMTYTGGRTFVYDSEAQTIKMHNMYYLTFDAETGTFNQSIDEADACTVLVFGREMPKGEKEEKYIPDGSDLPVVEKAAVKNSDGSITLGFVSDIHHSTDYPQNNLEVWFENVSPKVGYIDSMGSLGDMGSAYSATPDIYWDNLDEVYDYMDSVLASGRVGTMTYTFGNHEWYPTAGGNYMVNYDRPGAQRLMRVGEAVKTDDYIFYCFGAGKVSAQYGQGYDTDDIARLDAYLSTAPTDRPIFILTHFPLHLWGDRLEANADKVIDVLNKYPNTVVLWGHNHSDFDEYYDKVCRPGEVLTIDTKGTQKTINFTYLSGGCISDLEYTGPDGGSAWVQGKGLIVTINADKTLTFDYYDMLGNKMEEKGPYLVEFREGVHYETLKREYVEPGKAATAPEIPEFDSYTAKGWDISFDNITCHTVVTAEYDYTPARDAGCVYLTLTKNGEALTGKTGADLVFYKILYTEGMTVGDAFAALQHSEYEGTEDITVGSYGNFTAYWGMEPENGVFPKCMNLASGYAAATDPAVAGTCYYMELFEAAADAKSESYLTPDSTAVVAGESVDYTAWTWEYQQSRIYMQVPMNGSVYTGAALDKLTDTGVKAVDGKFTLTLTDEATKYVVVKGEGSASAYAAVTVKPAPVVEKTAAEKAAELIDAIGTVTKDSGAAIEAARKAYDALSAEEKAAVANADKLTAAEEAYAKLTQTTPGEEQPETKKTYKMLEGAKGTYTKGSKKGLQFRSEGAYSLFVGVKLDGKDLDKTYYKSWEGSTVVEISADCLETLKEGEHTVTLEFQDGSSETTFTVAAAGGTGNKPAKTGDDSHMMLWIGLAAAAAIGMAGVTVVTRKKSTK